MAQPLRIALAATLALFLATASATAEIVTYVLETPGVT